jgi:hypothetical protein
LLWLWRLKYISIQKIKVGNLLTLVLVWTA